MQHRESLRGRFKFDGDGRYALHFGVFTGVRFTSGWGNTPIGPAAGQRNMAARALYLSARPLAGVEAEIGGLYLVKGESTEITAYDEDGYVTGERVTLRRPRELFLDEIAFTSAFLTVRTDLIAATSRFRFLDDPNYRQLLIRKVFGSRVRASADYTTVDGTRTWRQAVHVQVPELRVADEVLLELYQRRRSLPDEGFAVTAEKTVTPRMTINGGYASIDPNHGGLNGDRFHIGNRAFAGAVYTLSPSFSITGYVTRAVGDNQPLAQRTMTNVMLTFNALPALKRTGLF